MAKLEDILKSRGWTDADITAAAPMLADARFRSALEDSYGAVESDRDRIRREAEERERTWQNALDTEYNPRIAAAEKQAIEARVEEAKYREQLKLAKEYGLLPADTTPAPGTGQPAAAATGAQTAAFDPKAHKLVTYDDVARFADTEGEAIAMVADLGAEYQALYGKSIFEYAGADGARGMRALRAEAKAARKNLDVYVGEKFNFAGKRQEFAAARQKEHDDAIRKEAGDSVRAEMAAQYGNPLLRAPVQSRQPFIPPKPAQGGQPWEKNPKELRNGRIERAMQSVLAPRGQEKVQ